MAGPLFKRELLLSLLNHIDEHKGEEGLWKTDRKAAVSSATLFLNSKHTGVALTERQVDTKVIDLCKSSHRKESCHDPHSLFVIGRSAIKDKILKSLTKTREDSDRARVATRPKRSIGIAGYDDGDDDVVELIQTRRSQHPKPGNFTLPPVRQAEPDQASKRQRVVEKPGSGKIDLCESNPSPAADDARRHSKRQPLTGDDAEVSKEISRQLSPPLAHNSNGMRHPPMMEGQLTDKERKRLLAYREAVSVLYHPYEYGPSPDDIRNLHRAVMSHTNDTISMIWDDGIEKADGDPEPQQRWSQAKFHEVWRSDELWQLVRDMFNLTGKEDLLSQLATSRVELGRFLTGLISAGMRDYVFLDSEIDICQRLDYQTDVSTMYQHSISEVVPDIHEHILRRTRQAMINKLNISNMAQKCVSKFHDVTSPLLQAHGIDTQKERGRRYLKSLQSAFEAAINLRAQLLLLPNGCEPRVNYPLPGSKLKPKAMKAADSPSVILKSEAKVRYVLFPSVMWMEPPHRAGGAHFEESALTQGLAVMEDGWERKTKFGCVTGARADAISETIKESRPGREEVRDSDETE